MFLFANNNFSMIMEGENMKGVVTNRQIFFIIFLILTGYSLTSIPKDAIKAAGTGAWVTISLLTMLFAIAVFFIASLNKKFPGKTIFEYSSLLLGKPIGFVISFIYSSNFLFVLVLICRGIAEFIKGSYLPLTPIWAILILIISVCLYISYKGITNLARLCEIYGAIFILTSLTIHFAQFFLGDIKYIQPFFEVSQIRKYIFGIKDLMPSFLGIEVLVVIPFGKVNNKKGILYSIMGVVYVGLFYIIAVEGSTMIAGINDILNYNNSLIEALRETRLPRVFLIERVDIIFDTVGIMSILAGLSVLFFAATENATKLTRVNKKSLFLSVGIFTFIISNFFIDGELASLLLSNVVPICGIFTAFIIPITLFLIAKVKKL